VKRAGLLLLGLIVVLACGVPDLEPRKGAPVVTDGPYPETQEVLAGYTIVDCVSFDRATEIAAGLVNPDADGEYVDVRPIIDGIEDLEG